MTRPLPNSDETSVDPELEARRATARRYANDYYSRFREMTKLEQSAYKLRKQLGEGFRPYTPSEEKKMLEIRRMASELQSRAKLLNAQIRHRLARETEQSEKARLLLEHFETQRAPSVITEPY